MQERPTYMQKRHVTQKYVKETRQKNTYQKSVYPMHQKRSTYLEERRINEVYLSTEEIYKRELVAPHSTPHHINHWRPKETL